MLAKESKATVMKMLTELEKTRTEHSGNFSKELENIETSQS